MKLTLAATFLGFCTNLLGAYTAVPNSDLKLLVDKKKITIPYTTFANYPDSLFYQLFTKPSENIKNKKYIKLDCSLNELGLAYSFITQNRLPKDYNIIIRASGQRPKVP